ncbi:MAG: SurA N-terminal domain-containing protein [Verrucomicrobiales bacterium]|nr:SurA N-terminal domain-containing protein [Verrucomicrobiales bacterium]
MKTLSKLLLLFALVTVESHANQSGSDIAATVNDVRILEADKSKSLDLTEFVLGAANFQRVRQEREGSALEDEIDRHLLREEFKRMGGQVKPEHIDQLVTDLIAFRFNGNETAFKDELSTFDLDQDDIRTRLLDNLISKVFQNDEALNGGNFDEWLEKLRGKSDISISE